MLVTSKAEREMKIEGLELGADDYVTKPFHPRELLARVRSLVRLRRLQAELAIRNALLESTNVELESTLSELKEAGVQLVQAERLAAVGELAAGVAHEVNNPVNFATNALKTLRSYVDDIRRVDGPLRRARVERPGEARRRRRASSSGSRTRSASTSSSARSASWSTSSPKASSAHTAWSPTCGTSPLPAPGAGARCDLRRGLESTLQLVRHALREARVEVRVEIDGGSAAS